MGQWVGGSLVVSAIASTGLAILKPELNPQYLTILSSDLWRHQSGEIVKAEVNWASQVNERHGANKSQWSFLVFSSGKRISRAFLDIFVGHWYIGCITVSYTSAGFNWKQSSYFLATNFVVTLKNHAKKKLTVKEKWNTPINLKNS